MGVMATGAVNAPAGEKHMQDYLFLVAGLAILLVGGDTLVRGAVGLSERLAIPPLIIGLTIVSLGTSAPELFISVRAALHDAGGIAIGNVVGSNIANVFLVLGLPAVIKATCLREDTIGRNLIVMLGITVVFMGMMLKGTLEHYDGAILLGLLILFLWEQYRSAILARAVATPEPDYHDEVGNIPASGWVAGALLAAGLVALPIGAKFTVDAATNIALQWQVSEEVIGLTIVAIGTSLPELAATLMAVLRNESSVALGNIVGSNIFNIAAIMGITAIIVPIPVGANILLIDMWVMLGATILIAVLAHYRMTIAKAGGLAMLGFYAAYIGAAFMQ